LIVVIDLKVENCNARYTYPILGRLMSQQSLLIKKSNSIADEQGVASRGNKRRAELIALAEQVFLKRGYANTSMTEISRHANASKSTLYKFFGNKKALFAEIVRSRVPDLKIIFRQVAGSDSEVADTLNLWGLRVLELITTPDSVSLYKILLAELHWYPELGQLYYEQGPLAFQRYLARYIESATKEGKLNCPQPEVAAGLFASMVAGDPFERAVLGFAATDWDEKAIKSHVREAVATLLARYGVQA
jgi:AcrR family transcriptional regulator